MQTLSLQAAQNPAYRPVRLFSITYSRVARNLPQTCHGWPGNHDSLWFDDGNRPCYFSVSPSKNQQLKKQESPSNDRFSIAEFASIFGVDPQTLQAAVMQAAIERKRSGKPFFTIPELAVRWSCSRGSVYNYLREAGARIVDFAPPGKKGKKLIPLEVVERIERQRTKRIE
jgi:hypothetical protein